MSAVSSASQAKTIGLVLDFFNPHVLEGAHAYLKGRGMRLDARWSIRGDWTPQKPDWDGVIYDIVDDRNLIDRIQRWKMPRVSLSAHIDDTLKIVPDYKNCGFIAAKQLVAEGAKSLLIPINSRRALEAEFAAGALEFARDHPIPHNVWSKGIQTLARLSTALVRQIKLCNFPLGLCQPHAGLAYSIQDALLRNQIRIPEDVSMIVIDKDAQRTPALSPIPLTTVNLDSWHQGFVAAEMIHFRLMGKSISAEHLKLPPKGLTHRASTGHQHDADHILVTALSFVRNHCLEPIDVSDVVEAVGASRRIVEMRFREALNRGIHGELSRLRIEEAKRRISDRDQTITDIAEGCGFSSVHYFSAAFKREAGLSPKQYQKQVSRSAD